MGRHTKAWHIYANHAHAIDLLWQQIERHAGSRGHAKISHDDRVIIFWLRQIMDRVANIFKKLAGDERFRIEGHIAHRAARTVEMAGEGQAIDATRTAGKDRRNAAHAQANAQRPKGWAHGLRLIMRPARIISSKLVHHVGLASSTRGSFQRFPPAMAGSAFSGSRRRRRGKRVHSLRRPHKPLQAKAYSALQPSTCLPWLRGSTPRHGPPLHP